MDVVVTSASQQQMTGTQFNVDGHAESTELDLTGNFFASNNYDGTEAQGDTQTFSGDNQTSKPDNTLAIVLGTVIPIVMIGILFAVSFVSAKRGLSCYRPVRDKKIDANGKITSDTKWTCVEYNYNPEGMLRGTDDRRDDHYFSYFTTCFSRWTDFSNCEARRINMCNNRPTFTENPVSRSCHVFDMKRTVPWDKKALHKALDEYKYLLHDRRHSDDKKNEPVHEWREFAEKSLLDLFPHGVKGVKYDAPLTNRRDEYFELLDKMRLIEANLREKSKKHRFGDALDGKVNLRQQISKPGVNRTESKTINLATLDFIGLDILHMLIGSVVIPTPDHTWKSLKLLNSFIEGNLVYLRRRARDLKQDFKKSYLDYTYIGKAADAEERTHHSIVKEDIPTHLNRLANLMFTVPDLRFTHGSYMLTGCMPPRIHKLEDLSQFFIDNYEAYKEADSGGKRIQNDLDDCLQKLYSNSKKIKKEVALYKETDLPIIEHVYQMFEHIWASPPPPPPQPQT